MDARRRAGAAHSYIRGVVDSDDHKMVFLHNDRQAQLSGRQPYVMADTAFSVVAPGGAKEDMSQAAIASSAARAFDWHHFSIVYVSYLFSCCLFVLRRPWCPMDEFRLCCHLSDCFTPFPFFLYPELSFSALHEYRASPGRWFS